MSTPAVARSQALRTWLMLVAATALSYALAEGPGLDGRLTTTAVLLIAALKVRWVFLHFMELHEGPQPWRLAFEAWVLAGTGVILAGYWAGQA
jgi:heme/copper-type cytochrome/quinol oxidase subunit 4